MLKKTALLMRDVQRFLKSATGEGGWSLHPHEAKMLASVLDAIPPSASKSAHNQLQTRFFVDRTNERINTLHFDHRGEKNTIVEDGFNDALFRLTIRICDRRQIARVTFYKGYIFSIETPKRGKFYQDKTFEVLQVERANPKASLTYSIDRLEHGNPEQSEW